MVPTENVRGALAAVESGNVDAGFVYKTDSLISKKVKIAVEISAAEGPKISYPIAVIKASKEPERAKKFEEYLTGPSADGIQEIRFHHCAVITNRDDRSVAGRFFHDQGFGNQHAPDPSLWYCARVAAGTAALAGKNSGGDCCHAAIVHSARRDRLALAHALWEKRRARRHSLA